MRIGMIVLAVAALAGTASAQSQLVRIFEYPEWVTGKDLVQTLDGGHAIVGDRYQDILLSKFDVFGNHEWTRQSTWEDRDHAAGLIHASDNAYVVTGWTDVLGPSGLLIARFDSLGSNIWTRVMEDASGYSVVETADGDFVVGGRYSFSGQWIFLSKFSKPGDCLWQEQWSVFGEGDDMFLSCLIGSDDGGYAATGHYIEPMALDYDVFVAKFDSVGQDEWGLRIWVPEGPDTVWDEYAFSLIQASDGGYVLVGMAENLVGEGQSALIVKVDGLGSLEWRRHLGIEDVSIQAYSVVEASDGGYVVAGSGDLGENNAWLAKFDATGGYEWMKTVYDGGVSSIVRSTDGGYTILGDGGGTELLLVKCDSSGSSCLGEEVVPMVESVVPSVETFFMTPANHTLAVEDTIMDTEAIEPTMTTICASPGFLRGDADSDTDVEMSDAIFTLKYLYVPGADEPSCMDAADSDDGGVIEMSDAIYTLKYLYVPGSPPPPAPGPSDCGADPTEDGLDCVSHPCMD